MKQFRVEKNEDRLDLFLGKALKSSRKEAKRCLDQGRVAVNDRKVIIASWKLEPGDLVTLQEENDNIPESPAAKNYFLKVLHEDDDVLVVEKDAGVPCEKSPVALKPSLPEIIYQYLKRTHPRLSHPVVLNLHRLDKETSGVMVYGKSKKALSLLEDFRYHRIIRKYLVLVHGVLKKDSGRIDVSLTKKARAKGKKMQVALGPEGKSAITEFRVLNRYPKHSLLEVILRTGRTHQVRTHLAHLGHPVVGDAMYGEKTRRFDSPSFLALHAAEIGFRHPVSQKKWVFRSKPPKIFREFLERKMITGI